MATFDRLADKTLEECRSIYSLRGNQYGDSWDAPVVVFSPHSPPPKDGPRAARVAHLAAMVDVKLSRIATSGFHDDSMLDAINYLAALRAAVKELEAHEQCQGCGP